MSSVGLLDLPNDIFETIFSYLDGEALGRLILVCRRLSVLCSDERYWQQLNFRDFENSSLTDSLTWRQKYGSLYSKYKFAGIGVYKRIRLAWNKIEKFFASHNSRITFEGPVSAEDISLFQQELGSDIVLPNDYICSLMIHNGQKIDESVLNGLCSGAYGSVYAYEEYKTEFLASTTNVLIAQNHVLMSRRRPELSFICLTIAVTNRYWGNSHLLCVTPNSGDADRKICFGAVISSPQLRQRFENPSWIVAQSYTEWLEAYADALDNNRFALSFNEPVTDNNELLRFYLEPECELKTGPYLCQVATVFVPEISNIEPSRFYFAYRISLSMDQNANDIYSCELQSRHWKITDGDGNVDKVDGPGVIGQFPVLRPGDRVSYVSSTYFRTRVGKMSGHFTMKYTSPQMSSQFVDIACPEFQMKSPDFDMLKCTVQSSSSSFDAESN